MTTVMVMVVAAMMMGSTVVATVRASAPPSPKGSPAKKIDPEGPVGLGHGISGCWCIANGLRLYNRYRGVFARGITSPCLVVRGGVGGDAIIVATAQAAGQ